MMRPNTSRARMRLFLIVLAALFGAITLGLSFVPAVTFPTAVASALYLAFAATPPRWTGARAALLLLLGFTSLVAGYVWTLAFQ